MAADKERYNGPESTASALGQSTVDGAIGLAAGAAVGAVAGSMLHDQKKHNAVKSLFSQVVRDTHPADIYAPAEISKMGGLRGLWHLLPQFGKGLAAAVGLAVVGGLIASTVGYFRGSKKVDDAKAQFNELITENKLLESKVEHLEAQIAQTKSFVNTLSKERSAPAELSPART